MWDLIVYSLMVILSLLDVIIIYVLFKKLADINKGNNLY